MCVSFCSHTIALHPSVCLSVFCINHLTLWRADAQKRGGGHERERNWEKLNGRCCVWCPRGCCGMRSGLKRVVINTQDMNDERERMNNLNRRWTHNDVTLANGIRGRFDPVHKRSRWPSSRRNRRYDRYTTIRFTPSKKWWGKKGVKLNSNSLCELFLFYLKKNKK